MTQPINGSTASYISKINSGAEWVDTQANRVNTIPIVGIFTSSVYAGASVVHFFVAGIVSLVGFGGQLVYGKGSSFKLIADAGSAHMQHAVLNYVCALGTGSSAGSVLGWVPLLAYQASQLKDVTKSFTELKENAFKPSINYATPVSVQMNAVKERAQKAVAPVMSFLSFARKAL